MQGIYTNRYANHTEQMPALKSAVHIKQSNIIMRNISTPSTRTNLAPPWEQAHQNLIRPRRETDVTRQMSCDVVFGSPSANCMGTGVCRISARTGVSPSAGERKRSCRSTVGLLFPIEGGNGVAMVLTRALLCTQLYRTHLRRGTLKLERPCPLPKDITRTLGLNISELPIGEYLVQDAEGFLRIDFKVASSK